MQHTPTNNAITRRLAKMQDQYTDFYLSKTGRVCVWNIQADESRMVDAFFKVEQTEGGQFDEFFMRLDSPFIKLDNYKDQLIGEFKMKLRDSEELLAESNIEIDLNILEQVNKRKSLFFLLDAFRKVIHPKDGRLVLFLTPRTISNDNHFEQWLYQQLKAGWPEKVRIMLSYVGESVSFNNLLSDFPSQIMILRPDLDMEAAMQELVEGGNPGDPAVKMRKLLMQMNLAASKGKMEEAEKLGQQAIAYSRTQPNMEHIEPTVYSALGAFTSTQPGNEHLAMQHYAKSTAAAQQAQDAGHPLGLSMVFQSAFSRGAALVQQSQFEEAAELYRNAAKQGVDNPQYVYQRMEAYRMAGICYYNLNRGEECWDCNWMALDLAEELDQQTRSYTALPYVGEVLMHYANSTSRPDLESLVESRMVALLGKSWRDQLAQQKSKEHAGR